MTALISEPPQTVCVLRLSAIGDTCHTLAVVRTLQRAWPHTTFTWIIGKVEAKLLGHIPDIEFIVVDKRNVAGAYRQLRETLRGRRFDILLHMQLSFRASLLSTLVAAKIKLGFDRERARELQWLFTTHRIRPAARQHVLDTLFGFAERLDVYERLLRWDIPLPSDAIEYARHVIPDGSPTMVVSPCSSHSARNWRADYYALVCDYAAGSLGMNVVLCGGRSDIEIRMGEEIMKRVHQPCANWIGKDTLPGLLAVLARAKVLLAPDSGPAHMATCVGTPVIGLYAATSPSRSGPYLSRQWCVDKYDAAAHRCFGKPASELPWTTKIERPGVMDLITPDDAIKKLHAVLASQAKRKHH